MMEKWEYASNYIGENYSDYYILYSHHRDSNILNNSNYDTLQKIFINLPGVIEVSANHWAVGWVESILIHEDAKETIEKGNEYLDKLSDYPVLDEDDLSNREYELVCNYADEVCQEIENNQGYFLQGEWIDEDIPEYLKEQGFNKNMNREEVIENIYDRCLIDW